MAKASAKSSAQTRRMVVLLSEKERNQLEKRARSEKVSAAEIVRRSLGAYQSIEDRIRREQEEEVVKTTLMMLASGLSEANESVSKTIARLDDLHLELKKRDIQ